MAVTLFVVVHLLTAGPLAAQTEGSDTGTVAAVPVASVHPTTIELLLPPEVTATATVTLSNSGTAALAYSAAFDAMVTVLVDFEDGQNPYGFTLGIPAADYIDETGGNPGRWFRNSSLATFAPSLYIYQAPSPYLGNYVEREVDRLSVDARTVEATWGIPDRPYSLVLTNFNGEPNNVEAHHHVYLPGPEVPQPGAGWEKYTYSVPFDYPGGMPDGWGGGYYGDPENLPPGVTFQDVISQVDQVRFMWGHPAFFYLLQDFDIGVDNVGVRYRGEAPAEVAVEPSEGSVPAGESEELTIHVDTTDMEAGDYEYRLLIETNDPDSPVLVVTLLLQVIPTSTEGEAPLTFELRQNYPNPFSGSSAISFALPEAAHVRMDVFDLLGRRVATLVEDDLAAGDHVVIWDVRELSAGVYLYRLQSGSRTRTLRAVVTN